MPIKRLLLAIVATSGLVLATGLAAGTGEAGGAGKGALQPAGAQLTASLLGPEFRICCGAEDHHKHPSMVYNRLHREYLVVYHSESPGKQYISGARIDVGIGPVSHFLVSSGASYDCCLYPDVAYSWHQDRYLAVWQQYNAAQSRWEIYGRFIEWDGIDFNTSPFKIAEVANRNLKYPVVAWNSYRGNQYMVAWQEEYSTGQLAGIGRRRVYADSTMPDPPGYVRQINNVGSPDITYSPAWNEYLVVWAEPVATSIDIYGGRLNEAGALQDSIFPVSQAAGNQQLPVVTTNEQGEYLVAWQDHRWTDDSDVLGQYLEVNGDRLGGEFYIASSLQNDTSPALTANGGAQQYMAVWQRSTDSGKRISGRFRDSDGGWGWEFEVAPGGFGDNEYPAVANHRAGYLVAYGWHGNVPGDVTDLYGREWTPHALFLPLVGRKH